MHRARERARTVSVCGGEREREKERERKRGREKERYSQRNTDIETLVRELQVKSSASCVFDDMVCALPVERLSGEPSPTTVQGYLAHKKQRPPSTLQ